MTRPTLVQVRDTVRRLLRPPRRLRVRRSGAFLIAGTLGLGLATLNTGNNLLYLLLGALLGTIALSGWLSEQTLRGLELRRRVPRAVTAGLPGRIEYTVHNRKRRLPSYGVTVQEVAHDGLVTDAAFLPVLETDSIARSAAAVTAQRRGVYPLHMVTISTAFPFGLFAKERDIAAAGVLIVWPRTDVKVRVPRVAGQRGARAQDGARVAAGAVRGEFRGLREYRPGDDPRDVHWRSSARRGSLIVREYDRDTADIYWLVLDTTAPNEEAGEAAVETMASLVAAAAARGDRFGVAVGTARIPPGTTGARVDEALDMLAGAVITVRGAGAAAHMPVAPDDPARCVLVTARAGADFGFGDVITPQPASGQGTE